MCRRQHFPQPLTLKIAAEKAKWGNDEAGDDGGSASGGNRSSRSVGSRDGGGGGGDCSNYHAISSEEPS